jgi:protein-disulfide isomerase
MSKNVQVIAWVAFIAIVGGVIFYSLSGEGNGSATETGTVSGTEEARSVEIIKYSDYSCPACKAYIPFQEQLKRDFGDQLTIEYRHFPLGGFQYSNLAARAVEAASEQGLKDEMHDKIFEGQELWTRGNAEGFFMSYAEELDLDIEQFQSDLEADQIRERVQRQRSEGERRMVQSTPTFFINGQRIQQNPQNYDQFRSIVEMYMYR